MQQTVFSNLAIIASPCFHIFLLVMIKAFIFDLDGTIVNTELTHYKAWERTLLNNWRMDSLKRGVFLFDAEGCYAAPGRIFSCFSFKDVERRRSS
ncbi:MAG: HAD hydrolase-like protein [Proteobacteria bacterium]|nr:HAD hydrolase-like protein [Pseudomonadota bacterium]